MTTNITTAIGYVRVSTDRQGLSLEAQAEKIRAMAVVKGVELADLIVDEAESAKDLNRPGVQKLLALVKARKVGIVIIAKLDRLTRNVRDLGELVELLNAKGVSLVSVAETLDTTTAAGRMVMNMIGAVSQWEREVISERTTVALKQKRANGEAAGNVPYGYRVMPDGKLAIHEGEHLIVTEIKRASGHGMSCRAIADWLNQSQYRTRKGGQWRFQYVANVLKAAASN